MKRLASFHTPNRSMMKWHAKADLLEGTAWRRVRSWHLNSYHFIACQPSVLQWAKIPSNTKGRRTTAKRIPDRLRKSDQGVESMASVNRATEAKRFSSAANFRPRTCSIIGRGQLRFPELQSRISLRHKKRLNLSMQGSAWHVKNKIRGNNWQRHEMLGISRYNLTTIMITAMKSRVERLISMALAPGDFSWSVFEISLGF